MMADQIIASLESAADLEDYGRRCAFCQKPARFTYVDDYCSIRCYGDRRVDIERRDIAGWLHSHVAWLESLLAAGKLQSHAHELAGLYRAIAATVLQRGARR